MEWYHQWESEYRTHKEEHKLGTEELDECLNCELCHPIENEPIVFKKFWDALFKFEDTIIIYNNVTIKGVIDLLSMNNSEREDTIHKGKCRDIMDRITESIRYRIQPKMKEKRLRTIILVIVRDCIERNLGNEVFDRLIGNPELIEHKYILEDWDVERRFEKFWQWYRITSKEVGPLRVKMGAIKTFRELLYEEVGIAMNEEKVKELMFYIEYENINIENVHKYHKNMVQKIIRIFIDTRGFTKELEDSESEDSPASYELENSSEEELEIIIGDKSWKFSELKRKTSSIDEDQLRYIWKIGIKLMIEMDILVTKSFIDKVQEIEEMDVREKELKIKEWLEKETVICKRCGNRRFKMDKTDNECGECIKERWKDEQDELIELKNNLEKLGYEIDVSEIQRIKNFGVNNRIIVTEEFIERYLRIIELEDRELRKEVHRWLNENTTWCERCEIRWMNDMFRLGGTVCKDCEEEDIDEIDDRVKRLQKIFEDIGTIIIEEELLRLTSMGYTDGEILDKEFIEIFQENKNESEKELKKKLDKLLKEQAGIIDSEESGEKSDNETSEEDNTDDSEKTGEILSPDEIWDENIENFNEDEFEDEIENVINRGGSDLSQNSDTNSSLNIKNSDNESELSDYNLQDLFQENISNMATENQIKRLIENALGFPANTLNAAVGAGASLIDRIENAGNEAGGVISVPLFYGKEDEDVNDWVRQFEVAFTAVGKAAGANGTRQAAYAAAHLRGAAAQWYNEMKEVNVSHLVNWADVDNDNDLKHRIKRRFTREDVRRKKMLELRKTRQEVNESVEEYTRRFRQILRIATREHALAEECQVDHYIEGLEPTIGYQVRRQNPANLNGAIDIAVREEGAKDEFFRKVIGTPISARIDIGKDDNRQNMFAKPLSENYEDELVRAFEEKARISKLEGLVSNIERRLNNDNRNRYQSNMGRRLNNGNRNSYQSNQNRVPTCFRCNRVGHYKNNCPEGRNARVNMVDEELNYHNELYAKDNAVKTRRQTRRSNPIVGYKNNGEEGNLQEELREAGNRMDDREIPSGTTAPSYTPERTEQNWDRPIGPRKMKWSNKRQDYYDPTEGLRKWREAGGPTKLRVYGPRLTDKIPPYDIIGDVKNCRANITYGQLINENTKYHKQLREGTYKPRSVNERN
ncbi:hypothetical protein RirG_110950 [Rhizophagus irregularis DAOM 197198w]|uniref:CCHC-type domain-containing protein n=1 Tax=Rhizophagus irregularis (strain DAOM 197198w) TaxID=1432141 RepID=A0A015MLW6_RHIIW|nr:hypothetical protein RirG_110950 [Rhizophagus irregularis DAOM 197198w]